MQTSNAKVQCINQTQRNDVTHTLATRRRHAVRQKQHTHTHIYRKKKQYTPRICRMCNIEEAKKNMYSAYINALQAQTVCKTEKNTHTQTETERQKEKRTYTLRTYVTRVSQRKPHTYAHYISRNSYITHAEITYAGQRICENNVQNPNQTRADRRARHICTRCVYGSEQREPRGPKDTYMPRANCAHIVHTLVKQQRNNTQRAKRGTNKLIRTHITHAEQCVCTKHKMQNRANQRARHAFIACVTKQKTTYRRVDHNAHATCAHHTLRIMTQKRNHTQTTHTHA